MNSSATLNRLAAYVPTPAALKIAQQPHRIAQPTGHRVLTAVLFADISGFTALSELLSKAGPTGAEELSQLINQYFTCIIQTIETFHGQVVKFSGDALTALFLAAPEDDLRHAIQDAGICALTIQTQMADFVGLHTSGGSISLSMRVGVGAGKTLVCDVGGEKNRWEYVVAGNPLAQAASALSNGQPGDVIFSPQAWRLIDGHLSGRADADGFARLDPVHYPLPSHRPIQYGWHKLNQAQQQQAQQALESYIPLAIQARLKNQTEWLAELRRMTVMFVGVSGIDYEASNASARLHRLVQATQEVTYALEGTLDKVAVDDKGTVILILFGVPPYTHEDDARRAVTCSLRLQAIAEQQGLQMTIGIAEGSVFAGPVGAPSRKEYTVIGNQVNVAARLMQHGRPGSLIISQAVNERIKAAFSVEGLGTISLRGLAQPLPIYQVQGEEGAQLQFVSRYFADDSPLIGREAELAQIRQAVAQIRENGRQALFIEGELGLGKSRLVSEMVRQWMLDSGGAYGTTCSSYGRQIPYQAWRGILAAMYDLTPDLPAKRQLARLAAAVADVPDPPGQPGHWAERLPLLSDVMGLEIADNYFSRMASGRLRRNNIFALLEALLQHQTKSQPLLVILEDIHWADELSLSLAAHVAQNLGSSPLLLVFTYRPMAVDNLGELAQIQQQLYAGTILLQALSEAESASLVGTLVGNKPLTGQERDLLLSRGQGNPFFLQEFSGAFLNAISSQNTQTPITIQDAILAKIDRLTDAEKLTLKAAAVIGTSFETNILQTIHPGQISRQELSGHLENLARESLLRQIIPQPVGRYAFYHVITQEVVYEGLLLTQRRQLHTVIGQVLEQDSAEDIDRLAFHFRLSANLNKGLYYLRQAAEKAAREYANRTAIEYLSQILDLMAHPSAEITLRHRNGSGLNDERVGRHQIISHEYWDTVLERAKLYTLIGQRNAALEDLGTLGILAEALNDNGRRALAAKQWASFYETEGDYASGLEMIERAVRLAHQTGDEKLVGAGYNHWGKLLYLCGDYEKAHDYLEQAARFMQQDEDPATLADSLHNHGVVSLYQAKYDLARIYFQEAVELWQQLDEQVGLGRSLQRLGQAYYKAGQLMASLRCYRHTLDLYRKMGDLSGEGASRSLLGRTHCSLGDYTTAREHFMQALAILQIVGDRRQEAETAAYLGFLHGRLNDHATALDYLETALAITRDLNDPWLLSSTLTYCGWIMTAFEQPRQAQLRLQEALRIERDIKHGVDEARITENLALLGSLALMRQDLSLAQTCAQYVSTYLAEKGTSGIEHPAMVYLTTYQILQTGNDPRAQSVLEQGQQYMNRQATQIDEENLYHSYINSIPENRTLQELALI